MVYTKTTWVNGQAPAINEDNLNKIEDGIYDAHEDLATHKADTTNPHSVTKTQVGLGNVTDDAQLKAADLVTTVTNDDTKVPSAGAIVDYMNSNPEAFIYASDVTIDNLSANGDIQTTLTDSDDYIPTSGAIVEYVNSNPESFIYASDVTIDNLSANGDVQTTITDSDAHLPTSGAVVDYVNSNPESFIYVTDVTKENLDANGDIEITITDNDNTVPTSGAVVDYVNSNPESFIYVTDVTKENLDANGDIQTTISDSDDVIPTSGAIVDYAIPLTQKAAANGVATLGADTKIPLSQIPDTIVGSVEYQGTWDADTNTPTLPSASGVKGDYYVVSVAGTYETIAYNIGDWVISNGTDWEKVDNTDQVSSVFGRQGTITAQANDYTWVQIDKTTSDIADIANRSHTDLTDIGTNTHAQIDTAIANSVSHIANASNPHSVTKTQVGLSNVTNDAQLKAADLVTTVTDDDTKVPSAGAVVDYAIPLTQKAAVNGVATLDANGKIPLTQLSDSILGQVEYKGLWDADTNDPTLPDATTVQGNYYIVDVAGTYETIDFEIGDWIISDGVAWGKVDNTDAVSSVFGRTGNVTAQTNDYTWAQIDKTVSDIANITTRSHTSLTDIGIYTHGQIDTAIVNSVSHIANTDNPHAVDKTDVGLGNVTDDAQLKAADLVTTVTDDDTKVPSAGAVVDYVASNPESFLIASDVTIDNLSSNGDIQTTITDVDTMLPTSGAVVDYVAANGTSTAYITRTLRFNGPLSAGSAYRTDALPYGATLDKVKLALFGSLPTGADIEVQVTKNGTGTINSVFVSDSPAAILTTQSAETNGIYITDGTLDSGMTSCSENDYFVVTITQVGSTFAGSDLDITLSFEV